MLVTGDLEVVAIERLLERQRTGTLLDADVYVVGHHGSANGTTRELLAQITPKVAVMQTGRANRQQMWTAWAYGHPRQEVVQLLGDEVSGVRHPQAVEVGEGAKRFHQQSVDRAIYATGWDGAIDVYMTSEGSIRVETAAEGPGS